MLRVGPDESDCVHDWHEQVSGISELQRVVSEFFEQVKEGLEVLVVLVGLSTSSLNFLLELTERSSVGRFVLLEEFEDFLDPLRAQLFAD